jgi:RND family efflux transporter MFP subunit
MSKKKTLIISLSILFIAAIVTFVIFRTEPEAQRSGATKETAMLVDVIAVEKGDFKPVVTVTGTVMPAEQIVLSPRVGGEIIQRADNFVPGGMVKKGDVLLRIDPSDYNNILALRKSDLSQALADLNIEQGRQDVARKDYELVEESLAMEDLDLVLREPQLNAVKAQVAAARAAVDQAELDLARTTVRAPFDAQILARNVNVGSQVNPNTSLATLVGTDLYWVILNVPLSRLSRINFSNNEDEKGSKVVLQDRKAWKPGESRTGYVNKLIGALDQQTRLARVIVEVKDPLGVQTGAPPLVINSFVEAEIEAEVLPGIIRLNRDYLREDQTVWVAERDSLRIQDVNVVYTDENYVYIDKGLDADAKVVTTNLATVTEGAPLKIKSKKNNETDEVASRDQDHID